MGLLMLLGLSKSDELCTLLYKSNIPGPPLLSLNKRAILYESQVLILEDGFSVEPWSISVPSRMNLAVCRWWCSQLLPASDLALLTTYVHMKYHIKYQPRVRLPTSAL